ncbi:MAG: hypothetical protein ABI698_08770 [bacterium]
MRVFQLVLLTIAFACAAAAQIPQVFPHPSQRAPARDGSLMQPGHPDYEDAMQFARVLNERGIHVLSVHRSKLDGFFPGIQKAAFFKTENGVAEVIFFPEPEGAENVIVTERREAGRYLYSFAGQPNATMANGFDSVRPMYFLMHGNWFIVLDDESLYHEVKRALKKHW